MTYQHFGDGDTTVRSDGVNDAQFAASRDSIDWMRYDRRPYIGRGMPALSTAAPFTPLTCAAVTGSLQMYIGSPWGDPRRLPRAHDEERRGCCYGNRIGMVVQRLDGFLSVGADYTGGTTPPLRCSGERGWISTSTSPP